MRVVRLKYTHINKHTYTPTNTNAGSLCTQADRGRKSIDNGRQKNKKHTPMHALRKTTDKKSPTHTHITYTH